MGEQRTQARLKTPEDAAKYLQVSVRQLKTYRDEGRLQAIKLSHKVVRYDVADLDAFVEASREPVE